MQSNRFKFELRPIYIGFNIISLANKWRTPLMNKNNLADGARKEQIAIKHVLLILETSINIIYTNNKSLTSRKQNVS